jgi:hypothetical protein
MMITLSDRAFKVGLGLAALALLALPLALGAAARLPGKVKTPRAQGSNPAADHQKQRPLHQPDQGAPLIPRPLPVPDSAKAA